MRRKRVCGYFRRGYTMSRRGRIAILHEEFPIGYFVHKFGLPASVAEGLLIYMGIHHTGMYGDETRFYRLPDKDDPDELMKIFDAFHSLGSENMKFNILMSEHLQKGIDEKKKKMPKAERPRKRRKRRKFYRRRKYSARTK